MSIQSYSRHTTHFFLFVGHLSTLTGAHHQQFHTTTYIFSFVIMSSFLLKKSICGKLCFSVSIWRIGCRIASNTCEGLWRQYFIGNNVQRLVSPVLWQQFWPEWKEAWKSAQEGWELSIAGSFGRGRYPIAKNACRAIGCFSSSHFHVTTCHGEDSKDRKMGAALNWTISRWSDAKNTCQILLARQKRKSFLHRIVTGDEKWIYFQNSKRKKSWVDPTQPSTSSSRPNRFGRKTMLCVWWDQEGVIYYELLKPGETVNAHRYH